jgi:hypothetical protein
MSRDDFAGALWDAVWEEFRPYEDESLPVAQFLDACKRIGEKIEVDGDSYRIVGTESKIPIPNRDIRHFAMGVFLGNFLAFDRGVKIFDRVDINQ